MMNKTPLILILLAAFLSGCARTRTSITMTSEPSDVQVTINGGIIKNTPFTVSYSNAQSRSVIFSARKYGYNTMSGVITSKGGEFNLDFETSKIISSEPLISVDEYFNAALEKEMARENNISTTVIMKSEPNDAQITINDNLIRYTPFIASYTNGRDRSVSFSVRKSGYKTIHGVIPSNGGRFLINMDTKEISINELPEYITKDE